uniref:Uncharacterized protein n=1 Tax=Anas platyrhynchos platyrhynchos TaxID=8840 RepID=A0A493U3J0_ANAPP
MSGRRSGGQPEYLSRRIPQNPKYQHIKTRLDTGKWNWGVPEELLVKGLRGHVCTQSNVLRGRIWVPRS